MCGLVGVVDTQPVQLTLYDALIMLQHRGQDAAGIMTDADGKLCQRRKPGLINQVFREARHLKPLKGKIGIAHTRYPTAGSFDSGEVQPFYVNSPCGLALCHNGNIINSDQLRSPQHIGFRHINTNSDSEVLLNVFAHALEKHLRNASLGVDVVFQAVADVQRICRGAYSVVILIIGFGVVAFRDVHGVRPLCLGKKSRTDSDAFMIASESVSLDVTGFSLIREIEPGETLVLTSDGGLHACQSALPTKLMPCLFEYVYFSRPDSVINGVSVFSARECMGRKLGEQINHQWSDNDIDLVVGIPDTSRIAASALADTIGKPYSELLIKNRYVGRTFIMSGQEKRRRSIKRKLNMINAKVRGKNVLLIDDSIVRGNTAREIVRMTREAGANRVYLASAAPPVCFPNLYGIDMPTSMELLTSERSIESAAEFIGCDRLIYQTLEDLEASVCEAESSQHFAGFENSVFSGVYLPGDTPTPEYLDFLLQSRGETAASRLKDCKVSV